MCQQNHKQIVIQKIKEQGPVFWADFDWSINYTIDLIKEMAKEGLIVEVMGTGGPDRETYTLPN